MSRAVEDGQLKSVSPTQISEFLDCPRKWWFNKVGGLKPEATASQELGTRIHEQMETYFQGGEEPSHPSARAALVLKDVPARGPHLIVEEPRNYALGITAADVPMRGRIDLRVPPEAEHFRVLDWKSCKDWRYLKTPEELARNPQGIVYLKYGFKEHPEAKTGDFSHIYLRTRGGYGARPVVTEPLTRGYIDEVYATLEGLVSQMKETAGLPLPEEVPHKTTACDKYGGCPYRDVCPATRRVSIESLLFTEPPPETMKPTPQLSSLRKRLQSVPPPEDQGINPPDAAAPHAVTPYEPPAPEPQPRIIVGGIRDGSEAEGLREVSPEVPPEPARPIPVLYVNCCPDAGAPGPIAIRLEDEIASRTPELLELLRQKRPDLVPMDAVDLREVGYGAGPAALVASFKKQPPRGPVLARTEGLSAAAIEALVPMASVVVRGLR